MKRTETSVSSWANVSASYFKPVLIILKKLTMCVFSSEGSSLFFALSNNLCNLFLGPEGRTFLADIFMKNNLTMGSTSDDGMPVVFASSN